MKEKLIAALAVLLLALARSAGAEPLLGQEPDPSLIVSAGGYEWVWASPCAGEEPSCSPVQLHHGFRFPTLAEWNASFASRAALIAAFIPDAPDPERCAAAYFTDVYVWCDAGDVVLGAIWHSPLADELYINDSAADTFLIRGAVPEPGTTALLGLGIAAVGALRRRRR